MVTLLHIASSDLINLIAESVYLFSNFSLTPSPLAFGDHFYTPCNCELDFYLGYTYKQYHAVFVFLILLYFTKHNVLIVHPCYRKRQDFLFSCAWIFHCICVCLIFFIHSSTDQQLGCFHTQTIVDNAAINTETSLYLKANGFVSFE